MKSQQTRKNKHFVRIITSLEALRIGINVKEGKPALYHKKCNEFGLHCSQVSEACPSVRAFLIRRRRSDKDNDWLATGTIWPNLWAHLTQRVGLFTALSFFRLSSTPFDPTKQDLNPQKQPIRNIGLRYRRVCSGINHRCMAYYGNLCIVLSCTHFTVDYPLSILDMSLSIKRRNLRHVMFPFSYILGKWSCIRV